MTYDNTNRGTLGKNKRKEKDTHPDYAGKCDINGTEYWISGWLKESSGEKFFSLSFKPKDAAGQQAAQAAPAKTLASMDDDIPF